MDDSQAVPKPENLEPPDITTESEGGSTISPNGLGSGEDTQPETKAETSDPAAEQQRQSHDSTPPEKPKEIPKWKQYLDTLYKFWLKYWFLIGLGLAIGLAAAWPDLGKKGGILKTDLWVKYVATVLVFLLTGITLKSQVLGGALLMWKLHLATLAISLGFIPLFGWGIGTALFLTPMNKALASGLIIATCCPTTVASNVVMTKNADGNEAAAVVGAVLGNVVGIFISPMLILAYAKVTAPPPYSKLFFDLSVTVLIPLVVGQFVRFFFPKVPVLIQKHFNIGNFNNCMILLMVWSTFSETFSEQLSLQAWEIVVIVVLDMGMYLTFAISIVYGSFHLVRFILKPFNRADAIAMSYVGSTKTIALGIPLINIIYANDPQMGLYAAPLLIYHACQLLLGAFTIPVFKKWKRKGDPPETVKLADEEVSAVVGGQGSVELTDVAVDGTDDEGKDKEGESTGAAAVSLELESHSRTESILATESQ